MRRRQAVAAFGLAAAAWPFAVVAEPIRRTIAVLMPYSDTDAEIRGRVTAFRDELRRLGWSEQNIQIEYFWTTDNLDLVRAEISNIVNIRPEVIFFTGGRLASIIRDMTLAVPAVFAGVTDPLGRGLVPSLAKPGGNLTGIALPEFTITAKLLEILKRVVPELIRAALILNPANPTTNYIKEVFYTAALSLKVEPSVIEIRSEQDIEPAFDRFSSEPSGGIVAPADLTLLAHRERIIRFAASRKVPTIYSDRAFVTSGGLISYSADRTEMFRQAAVYVSRILRGERAGSLPIQQPTKFELVVNMNVARALGRVVPATVLAIADEVIE